MLSALWSVGKGRLGLYLIHSSSVSSYPLPPERVVKTHGYSLGALMRARPTLPARYLISTPSFSTSASVTSSCILFVSALVRVLSRLR